MNKDAEVPTTDTRRFRSNSIFTIISIGIGLTGIILFIISKESRDLIYAVQSPKTAVIRAKQSSKIDIQVHGTPVTRDVTSAQVVIWNNGKKPIRRENLLGPQESLFIKTGPENPIIEAKSLKVSRKEIVDLKLDQSQINEGQLRIEWKILEQSDGFLLQVIYFGDEETPITALATVEQQGGIRHFKHNRPTLATTKIVTIPPPIMLVFSILAGITITILGILMVKRAHERQLIKSWTDLVFATAPMLAGLFMIALYAYSVLQIMTRPVPPFEFW